MREIESAGNVEETDAWRRGGMRKYVGDNVGESLHERKGNMAKGAESYLGRHRICLALMKPKNLREGGKRPGEGGGCSEKEEDGDVSVVDVPIELAIQLLIMMDRVGLKMSNLILYPRDTSYTLYAT